MNSIKNMRELELYREKLKYRELLSEKELIDSTADIIDDFSGMVRDYAFELGTRMVWFFFKNKKSNNHNSG